jgi:AcrR family transcriptional regulator
VIEESARKMFAELGYERTSLRQVGLHAGVDPGLVRHYFGKKRDLFLAVVELPVDPAAIIDMVVSGDHDTAGLRLAHVILDLLEDEVRRQPMMGMIRAATGEPEAARLVREFLTRNIIAPIAKRLGSADADYRAGLVMSQIVGFALAGYVVAIEPLASRPRHCVAADLGATFQRYLLGELNPVPD